MTHYAHQMTPTENAIIWAVIAVFFIALICLALADCRGTKIEESTPEERQQVLFRECTDGPYFITHKSVACKKLGDKIVKYMNEEK